MAAVRHLEFLKVRMLCQPVKPLSRYRDFWIFQDGGRRHVGFWKVRVRVRVRIFEISIFNGQNGQDGRTVLSCQISLEPRPRYDDFYFSKISDVRHLGFVVLYWTYHCTKFG